MFFPFFPSCPQPKKKGTVVIMVGDDSIPALVRTVRDAAHLYAVAGNEQGLAFCREIGRLLAVETPLAANGPHLAVMLNEIQGFNVPETRLKRLAAEKN